MANDNDSDAAQRREREHAVDLHSVHSSSSEESEIVMEDERRRAHQVVDGRTVTEKDDIEACPEATVETGGPNDGIWRAETAKSKRSGGVIAGVLSRMSTKASWVDPGPPPDGGTMAWIQVVCCHLAIVASWGFINSFGVFQTYYVTALNRAPGDISWIGSVQIFLLFFIGTFTGRLTDAGFFRPVFLIGSFLGTFGLFMASLSTTYLQLLLSQGVCCGIGNGFMFCPALSLTSTYFDKKRSLALGITAAGSATGGMIFPAMVQQLLPKIGFGWTMRSLAFIQLAFLVLCNIGLRPRVPPRKSGALVDWASFKEAPYVLFAIGMFFNFWGLYFPFFFLGSFGRDIIGLSYSQSINLLIVLNGVGLVGRIIPNHIADRLLGPLNTAIPSAAATCLLAFAWMGVTNRAGLYAWSIVYGFTAAAIQSLFPAVLGSLTTDLRKAGTRMGMVFSFVSFAVLTGPPIMGQLIEKKNGQYQYAQIFSGCCLLMGCLCCTGAKMTKSRKIMTKL